MSDKKPKLWHCYNSRSLRALWALEEMGIDYDLEVMPFPPRYFVESYKKLNPLGTVPYFEHEGQSMTESTGICLYLVERFGLVKEFGVEPNHPAYADYLNWLFHSDATLTFPQTIFFRYTALEPEERRQPTVANDYRKWYLARLVRLEQHLASNQFLCDGRFTIADIAITYALHFGGLLGIADDYSEVIKSYLTRMRERPAFIKSLTYGVEFDPYKDLPS